MKIPKGAEICPYCGRNFIKSKEVIEETKIPKKYEEYKKEILNAKKDGNYRISTLPNTVMHVSSVSVPSDFVSAVSGMVSDGILSPPHDVR